MIGCANTYFANVHHAQIEVAEKFDDESDDYAYEAIRDKDSEFYMWSTKNFMEALSQSPEQIQQQILSMVICKASLCDVHEFDASEIENMRIFWSQGDLVEVGSIFKQEIERVTGEDLALLDAAETGRLIAQRLIDYWHPIAKDYYVCLPR